MSGENIIFNDKKISKINFYKNKKLSNIDETDVDKILVSKKELLQKHSLKYFIGCNDDGVIKPLCIKLLQMIGYVKCFDSNITISFKATDKKLLKTYTKIWGRVNSLMNIEFDSEPVYSDNTKYIKRKINLYGDKVNTNFQGKKVSKENASYSIILKHYWKNANMK